MAEKRDHKHPHEPEHRHQPDRGGHPHGESHDHDGGQGHPHSHGDDHGKEHDQDHAHDHGDDGHDHGGDCGHDDPGHKGHRCLADELLKAGYPGSRFKLDYLEYISRFKKLRLRVVLDTRQPLTRWDQSKSANLPLVSRFKAAIAAMRTEPSSMLPDATTYEYFVRIHSSRGVLPGTQSTHYMGINADPASTPGTYRFLPWHRRMLMHFEQELRRIDRTLSPGEPTPLSLPYWKWVDPFPAWLSDVPPLNRSLATYAASMPMPLDVDNVMSAAERANDNSISAYAWFSRAMEGLETGVAAHNTVHAYCGDTMREIMNSPGDPAFYLLHAEVDRLWHIWSLSHPGQTPTLFGADAVMDPWPESYDALMSIAALGYRYESEDPRA